MINLVYKSIEYCKYLEDIIKTPIVTNKRHNFTIPSMDTRIDLTTVESNYFSYSYKDMNGFTSKSKMTYRPFSLYSANQLFMEEYKLTFLIQKIISSTLTKNALHQNITFLTQLRKFAELMHEDSKIVDIVTSKWLDVEVVLIDVSNKSLEMDFSIAVRYFLHDKTVEEAEITDITSFQILSRNKIVPKIIKDKTVLSLLNKSIKEITYDN